MAQTLNTSKKLCKVMTNGPIPELGYITGPVAYPCRIDLRKVVNMVQHGHKVYEVNPKNHNEQVLLTIQNVNKNNFPDPEKYVLPQETKKETPAVAKKEEVVTATQDNLVAPEASKDSVDVAIATIAANTDEGEITAEASSTESNSSYQSKKNKHYKNDFSKR
jgi:hypothetical protein